MTAELDPKEPSDKRNVNKNVLKHDTPPPPKNSTEKKTNESQYVVSSNGSSNASTAAKASDLQPMKPLSDKATPIDSNAATQVEQPRSIEATASSSGKSSKNSQCVETTIKSIEPKTSEIQASLSTEISRPKPTHGGDQDTLEKPNLPLDLGLSSITTDSVVNKPAGPELIDPSAKTGTKRVTFTEVPPSKPDDLKQKQPSVTLDSRSQPAIVSHVSEGKQNPMATTVKPGTPETCLTVASNAVNKISKIDSAHAVSDPKHELEDTKLKARLPLVGPYGPFIHPSDTCLADARTRLRKALDQSRLLRNAFTDRVYEKYKVILRPVPATDQLVDKITSDPVGMNAKLKEEVRLIKEEKDLEKKDAQNLTAAGLSGAADAKQSTSSPSVETPDQLAYIGAGLSLVILPEADMKNSDIDMTKYQYRGPTNPETGQRNGGISAAAATAAEILLDRVRRSTIMRSDRLRRAKDGSTDSDPNTMLSRYHLMASSVVPPSGTKPAEKQSHQISHSPAAKSNKKSTSKISSGSTALGKSGRGRIQPAMLGNSILSLNPLVEDLDEDKRPSASTSALLSKGVGSKQKQQPLVHSHLESLPGRRTFLTPSVRRTDPQGIDMDLGSSCNGSSLELSQQSRSCDQRINGALPVHDLTEITDRARRAMTSILAQFDTYGESTKNDFDLSKSTTTDGEAWAHSTAVLRGSQRATEIGLMRGMQQSTGAEDNPEAQTSQRTTVTLGATGGFSADTNENNEIEPIVAFSVFQALGLIHDSPSSHRDQSVSVDQRLKVIDPVIESGLVPENWFSAKPVDLYRKIMSKKRSFTQAFSSEFSPFVKTTAREQANGADAERDRTIDSIICAKSLAVIPEDAKVKSDEGEVISIRGGGGDQTADESETGRHQGGEVDSSGSRKKAGQRVDEGKSKATKRPKSAPNRSSSTCTNGSTVNPLASHNFSQRIRASSSDEIFSVFSQNRHVAGSGSDAFSPQRNSGFTLSAEAVAHRGVADRFQVQAQQLQLQAAAMNHLSPAGDLAGLFGAGLHRHNYTGHTDWASLGAASQAAVNLLPSHSLTALGISSHQAAMLELSARDRAARALLAREHQVAAHAAAVHRHASAAMRGGAGVPGLSTQQAATLMTVQARAGLLSASPAARFGQLGAHSAATAAAILSSPAAAAYVGKTPLPGGSLSNHVPTVQHSESRPSSRHSTSSAASVKGKRPSSKGRKETKNAISQLIGVSVPGEPSIGEPKESHPSKKRKASEFTEQRDVSAAAAAEENTKEPEMKKPAIELPVVKQAGGNQASGDGRNPDEVEGKKEKSNTGLGSNLPTVETNKTSERNQHAEFPKKQDDRTSPPPATTGLRFFLPPVPSSLDAITASHALDGRIHIPIGKLFLPSGELSSVGDASALLEYLQKVGSSVPIPKALLSNPLKERLNIQSLRSSASGGHTPSIPREIVLATILVWLWAQHKDSFQRAFAKSGRIDVDPECKWLIQAATDAAARALMSELSDAMHNGGPLAVAMSSARHKGGTSSGRTGGGEADKQATASVNVDARVALIVNEALMSELCIDEEVDAVLPIYNDLVELLDETRVDALKAKSRERVLLATVVCKYTTMSESFAHAYVSSMVRAGEALGHGNLFEIVQDEETSSSTMIPYDIFSDELGAWEDPCRPMEGFTPSLTGEDLVRRAHARGMMVKSLKKMQDRNNLKGGTPGAGPYAQQSQGQLHNKGGTDEKTPHRVASGGTGRRKSSLAHSDSAVHPGNGSARATTITQYNPVHICTPMIWDGANIEKMPYGKHSQKCQQRALSINSFVIGKDGSNESQKRARVHERESDAIHSSAMEVDHKNLVGILHRSTEEVEWSEVASAFQTVNSEGRSRRRASKTTSPDQGDKDPSGTKTIIAPFCRRIEEPLQAGDDSDTEEEDLSNETMLARHIVVLHSMKERLDKFMEGRTTAGQRARQRAQARAAEKAAIENGSPSFVKKGA